ncbi:methyltransferase [Saccharopolyspora gloriosae]|uniref:methyltransferase n=1 Tax=Saccharopolyspora gloriosae TaxID=455344 RepID=UPI002867D625|nr:methyltransferase [Saccharopolyspora gloriosae]
MSVRLLSSPGVYRPQGDTRLLEDVLRQVEVHAGSRVLDVGTGTGALAVAAARAGAGSVTAIDVSSRAVLAARFNARIRGLPVRVRRIASLDVLAARRFDLVVSNPPYVPSAEAVPLVAGPLAPGTPGMTAARCWTRCVPWFRACFAPVGGCSSCNLLCPMWSERRPCSRWRG